MLAKVTSFALEFINRKGISTEELIGAMVAREYPIEGCTGSKAFGDEDDDNRTLRAESQAEDEKENLIHLHDSFEWLTEEASHEEEAGIDATTHVLRSADKVEIPSSI